MSPLELFGYIFAGIMLQVSAVLAYVLFGHLRSYFFLSRRLEGLDVAAPSLIDDIATGEKGAWKGARQFRVTEKTPEDAGGDICSFHLAPVDGGALASFSPGQFLTFQLDIPGSEKPVVRCYSLSNGPGGDSYRVSIKRVPAPATAPDLPPGISSNYFHDHVNRGDILNVRAPSGHFYLARGNSPVVLVAGGIGITPMVSMLADTFASKSKREIWLFYGVGNSSDHAMKGWLEEMAAAHENFHLVVCYSRPGADDREGVDYHHAGRVDVDLLKLTLPFQVYDFYICGPRAMMESMVPGLEQWGVPENHINYEAFGPASISKPGKKAPGGESYTVTFSKSSITATWDGSDESLLDFAENNGVEIASGCRGGGCGSCQTVINGGEVTYSQSPDFDPDEGSCLLCVTRPGSDLELEA